MNIFKTLFAVLALSCSFNAAALTDDESLEFTNAITGGDLKVVKKFVEADPKNVNEKSFAWTPLQMAANKGQMEVAKYLLSKGADMNYAHPLSKNTAFHLAAFGGFRDVLTLLAKSGADVNVKLKANVSLIRPFKDAENNSMIEFLKSLGVSEEGCNDIKCFEEPD
jgi:ankyrin repeat protein